MGQQQTMTVAAEKETKGGALRRMILALLVTALMAVMLVATAPAALASPGQGHSTDNHWGGSINFKGDAKNEQPLGGDPPPSDNGRSVAKGDFLN
jgi:hypothetical protein